MASWRDGPDVDHAEDSGVDLFTSGIANVSNSDTVVPIMAFGTGLISVYSSTSGVVMPAFLPTVPDLAQQLGAVEPVHIAWSVTVGGVGLCWILFG